jgi:hypothetical protein
MEPQFVFNNDNSNNNSCIQNFGQQISREEATWETSAFCDNNIKVNLEENMYKNENGIQMAQERVKRYAFVNTVMNL